MKLNGSDSQASSVLVFCSQLYEDVAVNELANLLSARPRPRLAPGLFAFDTPLRGQEIEIRLAQAPPIFTRQVLIDLVAVRRTGDPLVDSATLLAAMPQMRGNSLIVSDVAGRCPSDVALLDRHLLALFSPLPGAAQQLGVVVLPEQLLAGRILAGAGLPFAPAWAGGRPATSHDQSLVSRSALKLAEAIMVFNIAIGTGGHALDLGAAPGGWSQVLAAHGLTVIAVDPGALDSRVANLRAVTDCRFTAQQFLATTAERFDLIVDDMRLDARESARILVRSADVLRPGGSAVATLKLPEHRPSTALQQALGILAQRFKTVRARCLYYNRHEVTCYVC